MGKTNFTFLKPIGWLFAMAALCCLSTPLMAQVEATGCFACNDQINVTLDSDCSVEITLDMVAEGDTWSSNCPEGLAEALEVIVFDDYYADNGGNPDNVVSKCGKFSYVIQLKEGYESGFIWEKCWGYVNAEDKTKPEVVCPDNVIGLYKKPVSDKPEATIDGQGYKYEPAGSPNAPSGYEFNYLVCTDVDRVLNEPKSWNDPKYPYYMGNVSDVLDCSATSLVSVRDKLTEKECDEEGIAALIERTFTYEDEKGNVGSCTQRIYFFRPKIYLPECKFELDLCEAEEAGIDADNTEETIDPVETESGPYYINGMCRKVYLTEHICDLTLTYEDQVLPGPEDCGLKILRKWTILDWCWENGEGIEVSVPSGCEGAVTPFGSNKTASYEQHIIIGDKTAPKVECPGGDLSFSTGPFNCTAVINPPAPVVKGECQDWTYEFEVIGDVKDPKTGWVEKDVVIAHSADGVVNGIAPGYYTIKYYVTDACGNTAYVECPATVKDGIEPVAVCDDDLNISIGGAYTTAAGLARVTAADIDEGSWDNCELASLDVRRNVEEDCLIIYGELVNGLVWPDEYEAADDAGPNGETYWLASKSVAATGVAKGDTLIVEEADGSFYSWWAAAIYFTCCDISADASDKVTIELRATDASGNSNICWMTTLIEDKLPPRCEVNDETILCTEVDFDPTSVEDVAGRFGSAEDVVSTIDNCGAEVSEEVFYEADDCGTGTIERVFTITDASGRSTTCTQTITITEVNDYKIVFPGDDEATCGGEPHKDISTESFACDILAVNRDTARFEASGDECFKLLITYRVINWCEYDGESPDPIVVPRDWDGDDVLTEDHHIRVAPGKDLLPDEPGMQVVTWTQEDGDLAFLTAAQYANLTPGYWEYTQLLKVYDDVAPVIEVANDDLEFCAYGDPAVDCGGQVTIVFTIDDECTPDDTEVRSVRLDVNNSGSPIDGEGTLYTVTALNGNTYQISGKLPVGEHTFVVSGADGCGNLSGLRIPFSVVDCKSPAPICIQTLSVDLMPVDADDDGRVDGGMNTVWAIDFLASEIDDCSAFDIPGNVKYYAFKDSELPDGIEALTPEDLTDEATSVVFTCEDGDTELVYVVALDAAGNWDYCAVMVGGAATGYLSGSLRRQPGRQRFDRGSGNGRGRSVGSRRGCTAERSGEHELHDRRRRQLRVHGPDRRVRLLADAEPGREPPQRGIDLRPGADLEAHPGREAAGQPLQVDRCGREQLQVDHDAGSDPAAQADPERGDEVLEQYELAFRTARLRFPERFEPLVGDVPRSGEHQQPACRSADPGLCGHQGG